MVVGRTILLTAVHKRVGIGLPKPVQLVAASLPALDHCRKLVRCQIDHTLPPAADFAPNPTGSAHIASLRRGRTAHGRGDEGGIRRINGHGCKARGKPLGGKFGEADRELDRSAPPVHDIDRLIDSLRHLLLNCLLAPPALGLPARLPLAPEPPHPVWEAKPKQQTTFRQNFRRVYLRRIQVRSVTSTHDGIFIDCAFRVAAFGSSVTSLAGNRSCSDDSSPAFRVDLKKRWAVACTSRPIWPHHPPALDLLRACCLRTWSFLQIFRASELQTRWEWVDAGADAFMANGQNDHDEWQPRGPLLSSGTALPRDAQRRSSASAWISSRVTAPSLFLSRRFNTCP